MYSCSTKYTAHMLVFVRISLLNCLCWFIYLFFTFLEGVSYLVCELAEPLAWRGDTIIIWLLLEKGQVAVWTCVSPEATHRWNPNQLKVFECSNISVKRSECDSSSLHQHSTSSPQSPVSLRTVKDDHSDKQKNVITLQSHHAVYCQGGASPASRVQPGIMGMEWSRAAARDFRVCTSQGHRLAAWALKNV